MTAEKIQIFPLLHNISRSWIFILFEEVKKRKWSSGFFSPVWESSYYSWKCRNKEKNRKDKNKCVEIYLFSAIPFLILALDCAWLWELTVLRGNVPAGKKWLKMSWGKTIRLRKRLGNPNRKNKPCFMLFLSSERM